MEGKSPLAELSSGLVELLSGVGEAAGFVQEDVQALPPHQHPLHVLHHDVLHVLQLLGGVGQGICVDEIDTMLYD